MPLTHTCRDTTIPIWLVTVVGLVTIIGSILVVELWLARHGHADASDALAACLYFFLDAVCATAVTVLATEASVGCFLHVWGEHACLTPAPTS